MAARMPAKAPAEPGNGHPSLQTTWSSLQARMPSKTAPRVFSDDLLSSVLKDLAGEFILFGLVAGLIIGALLLAGCAPDFRHAAAGPPMTTAVPVANPFWCPNDA